MDILEEYRAQSDQTICVVGTIILSTKICMIDGNFSLYEKDEILKTSTNCPLSFSCNKLATDLRDCINEENITNCPDKYDEEDIRCTYD